MMVKPSKSPEEKILKFDIYPKKCYNVKLINIKLNERTFQNRRCPDRR